MVVEAQIDKNASVGVGFGEEQQQKKKPDSDVGFYNAKTISRWIWTLFRDRTFYKFKHLQRRNARLFHFCGAMTYGRGPLFPPTESVI